MVFIKDFIESRHHSLFDLGQLKVYILTCRLCPQVKMLFMSRFTSQLIGPPSPQVYYSPALGFNSILPLPSGSKGGAGGGQQGEERRMRSGKCTPLLSRKGPNISRHASRDPAGPLWLRPEWDEGVEGCSQSLTGLWVPHYSLIGHLEQQHHSAKCTI